MHGTTPPEPAQSAGRRRDPLAMLPLGLNAEFAVYLIVVVAIFVIALVNENVHGGDFVTALQWLTIGYLLSRGIAKASRVFEV